MLHKSLQGESTLGLSLKKVNHIMSPLGVRAKTNQSFVISKAFEKENSSKSLGFLRGLCDLMKFKLFFPKPYNVPHCISSPDFAHLNVSLFS